MVVLVRREFGNNMSPNMISTVNISSHGRCPLMAAGTPRTGIDSFGTGGSIGTASIGNVDPHLECGAPSQRRDHHARQRRTHYAGGERTRTSVSTQNVDIAAPASPDVIPLVP